MRDLDTIRERTMKYHMIAHTIKNPGLWPPRPKQGVKKMIEYQKKRKSCEDDDDNNAEIAALANGEVAILPAVKGLEGCLSVDRQPLNGYRMVLKQAGLPQITVFVIRSLPLKGGSYVHHSTNRLTRSCNCPR
jgi:hypothetical protein